MLFVPEALSLSSKISIRRTSSWRPVERYQKPRLAVSLHHKGDRNDATIMERSHAVTGY